MGNARLSVAGALKTVALAVAALLCLRNRRGALLLVIATCSGCAGQVPAAARTPQVPEGSRLAGNVHVVLGVPMDADPVDDVLIDRRYWLGSYNPKRLAPNWVAWALVASDLGSLRRQDDFRVDDMLPEGVYRVRPVDYRSSGFDRGHLCPSADRTATHASNASTFVMTNIIAQTRALNAGPWKAVEELERAAAKHGKSLQIVAGGIFSGRTTIGPAIEVPSAAFKIIVVLETGQGTDGVTTETPVISVLIPNTDEVAGAAWTSFATTVDEIERETGYDFLAEVPDAVESVIEARSSSHWAAP